MGKILWKVDKSRLLTAVEEYDKVKQQLSLLGNFFPWEVHPSKIVTAEKHIARLVDKLAVIYDSDEYQEYTSGR